MNMANGTYAEGVPFQSPGFAATPRTPGNAGQGDVVTPTGLDNRPAFRARSCCANDWYAASRVCKTPLGFGFRAAP